MLVSFTERSSECTTHLLQKCILMKTVYWWIPITKNTNNAIFSYVSHSSRPFVAAMRRDNTWSCETSPIICSLHLLRVMSCMIFSEPNCMKFWGQPRSSMHPLRLVSCLICSPESSVDRVLASSCQGRFCCISISTALLSIYRDSSYQGCCTYIFLGVKGTRSRIICMNA